MKKIILIITLLLAFISCIKSNEVKNDAKDISSISKSNLKKPKILNILPDDLKNIYKQENIFSIEKIDYDNSGIDNYIVTYEKGTYYIEDWFSDNLNKEISINVDGNISQKWFQTNTLYFIRALGYEDGMNYSYNLLNIKNKEIVTLFYFKPIIENSNKYYYGYINNIENLILSNNKLLVSYDSFPKDFDYQLKKTQKILPNIIFKGIIDGNSLSVELSKTEFDDLKNIQKKIAYSLEKNKKESYNFSIEDLLQENKSTPEKVVDELIFTKDKNDSLQINTEILDYISKTTTRENNAYLFSLENYAYKNRNREHWKISDRAKIGAYIFNTTYPLRKKYWADKFDEWYGGKPEKLLGSGSYWQENNYYGLPKLEEYERDFRITYW